MSDNELERSVPITLDFPAHPGCMLKEEVFRPRKITGVALARATGIEESWVSRMLNGKASVTPILAAKIEAATGYSAERLVRMQSMFDLACVRREQAAELAAIERIHMAA